MKKPIFVFLPGLGDDHRLYKNQVAVFPNSIAVDWIAPMPLEKLEDYAVRFAQAIKEQLKDGPDAPVVVCGLSLGGMIAPYVARNLNAVGIVLLCSIRSPNQFPQRYRFDWNLLRLCPPLRTVRIFVAKNIAWLLCQCCPCLVRFFVSPKIVESFFRTPTRQLVGQSRMMFDWAYGKQSPEPNDNTETIIPILQVHGTADWLLPIGLTAPDIRIQGGGHLLPITHPEEINAILERFVDEIEIVS